MYKKIYHFSILVLSSICFFHAGSPKEKVYIVPPKKKILKEEKAIVKKKIQKPFYLLEIFNLLKKSTEESNANLISSKLKKAILLLRKQYKGKKGKIPALDCLKKALYNIKNDKLSTSITVNIPKAILQIYNILSKDEIEKLKFYLSRK